MLTIKVNAEGVERKFQVLVDSVKDLHPVLKAFSKVKQAEVQRRFDTGGPGWAGLAAATKEGREQRMAVATARVKEVAVKKLGSTLRRDVRRALRKSGSDAIERRRLALKLFHELYVGGQQTPARDKGEQRIRESLTKRIGRAESQASTKVLGRIASSIKAKVSGGTLTLESSIPWAGVHNVGGTAGNSANIPARTFLEWTEEDLAALVYMFQERMLLAWD